MIRESFTEYFNLRHIDPRYGEKAKNTKLNNILVWKQTYHLQKSRHVIKMVSGNIYRTKTTKNIFLLCVPDTVLTAKKIKPNVLES